MPEADKPLRPPWLRRIPLPVLSILVGVLCGLAIWFFLDQLHSRALQKIFHEELQSRLEERARESLVRFDQYVASYSSTTKLVAKHRRLEEYLEPKAWDDEGTVTPKVYLQRAPEWAPRISPWTTLSPPSFLVLFDSQGQGREIYFLDPRPVPHEILSSGALYVSESRIQPYITTLDGIPFLLVSHPMEDSFGSPMGDLMLAVSIDDRFLAASQEGVSYSGAVVALLDADEQIVLGSSDSRRLPPGSKLAQWDQEYVVTAQSVFENEGSDLNMQFATFMPRWGMAAISSSVNDLVRRQRVIDTVVYISVFTLVIYLVSSRLNQLLRRISHFSQRALGIRQPFPEGGNQLLVLEEWMRQFIHLVRRAGDEMRRRHETEIRESEAVKSAIFASSLDSIITLDEQGCIVDCNAQAERLFGYGPEQAGGHELAELVFGGEDRRTFRDILQRSGDGERPPEESAHRELMALRADGTRFPVEVSVMRISLESRRVYIVYLHDISRRKKDEQEIQNLAKFASESPSPVLRVNERGVILYANDAAEPLFDYWGCGRGQTLPLYWRDKIKRGLEKGWDAELEVVSDGQIYSLLLAPISDLKYVNIYGRDITAVRRAEQASRQHQVELVHVCRLSTMGEMATGIAHELNQPLSAIINYANGCTRRLQQGIGGEAELVEAMAHITAQAERAGEIIRRLRSLVGKQPPDRSVVDINDLVREVVSFVEFDTNRLGLEIEFDLEPGGLQVRVDLVQIEQVLLNLVRNALDALRDVPEDERRLFVRTRPEGTEGVRVEIHDTGPGIDAETMEHLFDAFYTTKSTGMGMGLPISKTIIDDHSGRIWAESQSGRGTTFYVVLPTAMELAHSLKMAGRMQ